MRPVSSSSRYRIDSDDDNNDNYDVDDDHDDGTLDVPNDSYEPVLEEGANYVVTPSAVIADGVFTR